MVSREIIRRFIAKIKEKHGLLNEPTIEKDFYLTLLLNEISSPIYKENKSIFSKLVFKNLYKSVTELQNIITRKQVPLYNNLVNYSQNVLLDTLTRLSEETPQLPIEVETLLFICRNIFLDEFEKMIENPNVKEVSDIQNFLKTNPWIFGPEYKSLDFRDAGSAGNPDGRLLRIDGLSDILEVKLPKEELLRGDQMGRQFITQKLAESLGQLTGYLEYYYSEYSHERSDETGDEILKDVYGKYYKPKGILLIGRRGKEMVNATSQTISAEPKNMRRLLSYFHWVEVLTYDDLIERARNGLRNLSEK